MVMICEVCGNDYDKAFTVSFEGEQHTFDSFECAIQALAPTCAHCGCRVIGHGVEQGDAIFCCASCAKHEGATDLKDRSNGNQKRGSRTESKQTAKKQIDKQKADALVGEASEESFPASDPPAWGSGRD